MAAALALTGAGVVGAGVNLYSASECRDKAHSFRSDRDQKKAEANTKRKQQSSLRSDQASLNRDISMHQTRIGKLFKSTDQSNICYFISIFPSLSQ